MKDEDIDLSDLPEIPPEAFARAVIRKELQPIVRQAQAKSKAPAALRAEARRRAALLKDVPREQLVARFVELGDEIRREAIRKGTTIDGDWTGD
ncbi:MAG TPA: hypothetical protein VFC23_17255 [Thermoanaerobaculia bacterium]|nr:hypothetical protein [Thermoanaerobaculia bacterium]